MACFEGKGNIKRGSGVISKERKKKNKTGWWGKSCCYQAMKEIGGIEKEILYDILTIRGRLRLWISCSALPVVTANKFVTTTEFVLFCLAHR